MEQLRTFLPNKCVDSLSALDFDTLLNNGCVNLIISKLLSLGIVVGSAGLKLPQILKIVGAKSAEGIALSGIAIESFGHAITTAYFYRRDEPLSTFAESPIIYAQNILVILLALHYQKSLTALSLIGLTVFIGMCVSSVILPELVPMELVELVYSSSLLIVLGARLPQIWECFQNQSTGQNAFITNFLAFAGTLARLFTTLTEVDSVSALVVYAVSVTCNGICVLQFWLYWNNDVAKQKEAQKKKSQ